MMVSFSTSTLLPLLALVGVASAADRRCTPEHRGMRLASELIDLFDADSSGACAARCIADDKCVGYEFADNVCFLASATTGETYYASELGTTVSARCMNAADLRLLLTPTEKVDYPGMDVGSAYAKDPTECGKTCQDTPGCLAYSWTNYNGGSCWMKSGKPDNAVASPDGSVVSGQVYTCQTPKPDADAVGNDLANVLRPFWYDCCDVCRRRDGCTGFSWSNYNGGTCWLKTGISGFSNNAGVYAAVL